MELLSNQLKSNHAKKVLLYYAVHQSCVFDNNVLVYGYRITL